MIRPSLVEKRIKYSFSEWKRGLDKEDIEECGSICNRPYGELLRMHKRYLDFQDSEEVKAERIKLFNQ